MKTGDRFGSAKDVKKLLGSTPGMGVVIVKGRNGLWRIYDEPKSFKESKAECRALQFNYSGAAYLYSSKNVMVIISGHDSNKHYCEKIEGNVFCETCSL